jgi:hypothetical protein
MNIDSSSMNIDSSSMNKITNESVCIFMGPRSINRRNYVTPFMIITDYSFSSLSNHPSILRRLIYYQTPQLIDRVEP